MRNKNHSESRHMTRDSTVLVFALNLRRYMRMEIAFAWRFCSGRAYVRPEKSCSWLKTLFWRPSLDLTLYFWCRIAEKVSVCALRFAIKILRLWLINAFSLVRSCRAFEPSLRGSSSYSCSSQCLSRNSNYTFGAQAIDYNILHCVLFGFDSIINQTRRSKSRTVQRESTSSKALLE